MELKKKEHEEIEKQRKMTQSKLEVPSHLTSQPLPELHPEEKKKTVDNTTKPEDFKMMQDAMHKVNSILS